MSSTLALATRLAALPDDRLVALIERRGVGRGRVADFFDLAEALLEPTRLQSALSALERPVLATLARLALGEAVDETDAGAELQALADLALAEPAADAGTGWATYDAVARRLEAWPDEGLPSMRQLIDEPPPAALVDVPQPDSGRADQYAAEKAFHTVSAIAELLGELDREPARELQKGGLSLPDARRLASVMNADVTDVATLLWLAENAHLVGRDGSLWLTTDAEDGWLSLSTDQRWERVAASWLAALPHGVRALLRDKARARWGDALTESLRWLMPAGGETLMAMSARLRATGEQLGVSVDDVPSRVGALLVERGPEEATALLATLLPQEVDKVYVQHDLSIVSPGPLRPAVDARLRRMAEIESRALASTYRVTAASLERAIASGETAESLRAFLEEVSLTGIPQPLDYLISESASRYGLVRVRDDGRGRTVVHSTDAGLIAALEVDQSLSPLALVRSGVAELSSRFARDVVYWALADARYPVAAEDEKGRVVGMRKRHAAATDASPAVDRAAALVRKLREAGAEGSAPEAWLARQLEQAVRDRTAVVVTVALPGGSEQELLIEPTGVGGGRVRGRDRRADTERTLPLSSIRAVRAP